MAKRLAKKVVIYTNGSSALLDSLATAVAEDPVFVLDNRRVVRLEKGENSSSKAIVHLEDGTAASHGFVVSGLGSVTFVHCLD
jgi:hypothetical protein